MNLRMPSAVVDDEDYRMTENPAKYAGKPTAYLDHNILDLFVKHPNLDIERWLRDDMQVVYSDESLNEIKRSGDYHLDFLSVLCDLNAMHLGVHLTDKFESTGNAFLHEIDPHLAYAQYCSCEPIYDHILNATTRSLLKFYGGREGETLDQVGQEQIAAFDGLMKHLADTAKELEADAPGFSEIVRSYTKRSTDSFTSAIEISANQIRKNISDEKNWSGVQDYRKCTNIGPAQLNNVKGPNILEKIWELHKNSPGYRESNFSIEDFLGLTVQKQLTGRDIFIHEKVTSIYNVLNVVGYFPDSRMKNEKRFVAALSDAGHASIASFADYFLTCDVAMHRKAQASYEYLSAKTKLIMVTVRGI